MPLILADAINIPFVLGVGVLVLIPLLAFEVFVEAWIWKKTWKLPYGDLCSLAFKANAWSLLAGIPTKILNAWLYVFILPSDIPGYLSRYPFAIAIGSSIYFLVTLVVEGVSALRWRTRNAFDITSSTIWRGILWANLVTYAVLAPLHYFLTQPTTQLTEFTTHTRWASQPQTEILFIEPTTQFLRSIRLNGTEAQTIVPVPMADYLISTNLNLCLFRGTNGNLYLYRKDKPESPAGPELIWNTKERFFMDQVAFSPSGKRIAFASREGNYLELHYLSTGTKTNLPLALEFDYTAPQLAWSNDEETLYLGGFKHGNRLTFDFQPDGSYRVNELATTNAVDVLRCFGRMGDSHWFASDDWGVNYGRDTCGEFTAIVRSGLESAVQIRSEQRRGSTLTLTIAVNPGWLHLPTFFFRDISFVPGCSECLVESRGYLYLVEHQARRLGTLTRGEKFIQLSPRYEKRF